MGSRTAVPPLQFSVDQGMKLKKSSRVCIVGGGPAGLHMAFRLRQRGLQDVTILDKSDRVCGKVETIEHNGAVHEMGACWLSSSYSWVRALGTDLDFSFKDMEKGIGASESRDIIVDAERYGTLDMSEWMFNHFKAEAAADSSRLRQCLMSLFKPLDIFDVHGQLSAGEAIKAFLKYIKLHEEVLGSVNTFNFPKQPANAEDMEHLKKPFYQWLADNHLTILVPFMSVAQTAQGYGFIDDVPTYYALYWLTPELIKGYLLFAGRKLMQELDEKLHHDFFTEMRKLLDAMNEAVPPVPTLLRCGWEPLLRAMEEKMPLRTIVNANVTSIKRDNDKVTVQYKLEHTSTQRTMECDAVILAAPMPQLIDSILDTTAEEREAFGRLTPVTISTHLIDAHDPKEPQVDRQAVVTWPVGLTKDGQGHVYSLKNSRKAIDDHDDIGPSVVHSYVTYQLFNTPLDLNGREPPESVTEKMLLDVTNVYGITNVKIIAKRAYHYFYHFSSEDVGQGYPWTILKMQGKNRTLYAGCSVSFESVNDIIANNEMLLKHVIQFVDE